MNKILEFTATHESVIVPRILVQVHKAIDEKLPSAEAPKRQFTKTVIGLPPLDSQRAENQATSSVSRTASPAPRSGRHASSQRFEAPETVSEFGLASQGPGTLASNVQFVTGSATGETVRVLRPRRRVRLVLLVVLFVILVVLVYQELGPQPLPGIP